MGLGGIGIWQLLVVLAIVLLLFGSKKVRSLGADLGNAVKGFRGAMRDSEGGETPHKEKEAAKLPHEGDSRVIDAKAEAEAASKEEKKV